MMAGMQQSPNPRVQRTRATRSPLNRQPLGVPRTPTAEKRWRGNGPDSWPRRPYYRRKHPRGAQEGQQGTGQASRFRLAPASLASLAQPHAGVGYLSRCHPEG